MKKDRNAPLAAFGKLEITRPTPALRIPQQRPVWQETAAGKQA
jgi:hypothetical protein